MMHTLTHEPMALAGALLCVVGVFTAVWVAALSTINARASVREAADSTPGVVSRDATPGVDPIDRHIDTAAALLLPAAPVEYEVEFARDVACWLAVGAPENWSPPPVVKGHSDV